MRGIRRFITLSAAGGLALSLAACASTTEQMEKKIADTLTAQSKSGVVGAPPVDAKQAEKYAQCYVKAADKFLTKNNRQRLVNAKDNAAVDAALQAINAALVANKEVGATQAEAMRYRCLDAAGVSMQYRMALKLSESLVAQGKRNLPGAPKLSQEQAFKFSECFINAVDPYLVDDDRMNLIAAQGDQGISAAITSIGESLGANKEVGPQKAAQIVPRCMLFAGIKAQG